MESVCCINCKFFISMKDFKRMKLWRDPFCPNCGENEESYKHKANLLTARITLLLKTIFCILRNK